jgi:hypothetical protein
MRVDPSQALAEERVGLVVWRTLLVASGLALVGVLLPYRFGKPFEILAIAVVTAIPLVRVAWLIKRWRAIDDMKYVWWAVALLALVAIGPLLVLLKSLSGW